MTRPLRAFTISQFDASRFPQQMNAALQQPSPSNPACHLSSESGTRPPNTIGQPPPLFSKPLVPTPLVMPSSRVAGKEVQCLRDAVVHFALFFSPNSPLCDHAIRIDTDFLDSSGAGFKTRRNPYL
jgi:hypothetical protein